MNGVLARCKPSLIRRIACAGAATPSPARHFERLRRIACAGAATPSPARHFERLCGIPGGCARA